MLIEREIIMMNTTPEQRAVIRRNMCRGRPMRTMIFLMVSVMAVLMFATFVGMVFFTPRNEWYGLMIDNAIIGFIYCTFIFLMWGYRFHLFEEERK